tara:strand:+ start:77 stop:790 length:714 start_codon:yes stop_codon:yes gene_type:complete
MANTIVLPNEFDPDAINFSPIKHNSHGGKSVLINYNHPGTERGGVFILQTCRVRIPFGIDSSKPENGGPAKYHFSVSMANEETQNEQLRQFTENVRSIDEKARLYPQKNTTWFGKKLSEELVKEFYKSAEKFPKDPKWPSTLKIKLPFDKNGAAQFYLYDENKNQVNIVDADGNVDTSAIPKGCEAVCLVQSTGVWFVNNTQYGVGYKLLQAKIYKSNKLSGYSIVDSEDEGEETDE